MAGEILEPHIRLARIISRLQGGRIAIYACMALERAERIELFSAQIGRLAAHLALARDVARFRLSPFPETSGRCRKEVMLSNTEGGCALHREAPEATALHLEQATKNPLGFR